MTSWTPQRAIALVTGSSSGFGLLTSLELARRGLRVFASMRDPSRSQRLDAAARAEGLSIDTLQLDVTSGDSIARALDAIAAACPPAAGARDGDPPVVDVLVNNAGYGIGGFIEDLTLDEIRDQFETNFFGLVALTQAVIPGMRRRRRGRVINVSSIAGKLAQPGLGAYVASKFAVEGVSEALRHELLPHGVYVVLVEPGTFRTDIFDRNRRVGAGVFDERSPNYTTSRKLEALHEARLARNHADPAAVARAIADAAVAARPRLRYLVGRDAVAANALKSVVPFGLWERALARLTRPG